MFPDAYFQLILLGKFEQFILSVPGTLFKRFHSDRKVTSQMVFHTIIPFMDGFILKYFIKYY